MAEIIVLNVGGTKFTTRKSTLTNGSAYFDAMFNGPWSEAIENEIFIDRDPHIFKHILGLLRDSNYPYPTKYAHELDYFQISTEFLERTELTAQTLLPDFDYDENGEYQAPIYGPWKLSENSTSSFIQLAAAQNHHNCQYLEKYYGKKLTIESERTYNVYSSISPAENISFVIPRAVDLINNLKIIVGIEKKIINEPFPKNFLQTFIKNIRVYDMWSNLFEIDGRTLCNRLRAQDTIDEINLKNKFLYEKSIAIFDVPWPFNKDNGFKGDLRYIKNTKYLPITTLQYSDLQVEINFANFENMQMNFVDVNATGIIYDNERRTQLCMHPLTCMHWNINSRIITFSEKDEIEFSFNSTGVCFEFGLTVTNQSGAIIEIDKININFNSVPFKTFRNYDIQKEMLDKNLYFRGTYIVQFPINEPIFGPEKNNLNFIVQLPMKETGEIHFFHRKLSSIRYRGGAATTIDL